MRVFISMLRWMPSGIFALILFLAVAVPVSADTGTYRISNYIITLEPQSDGQVRITYEQQWKVLSGDIPWITVGLPNSSFSIESYSEAAARVTSASDITGVRVDLDKDYQPGQTFDIKFTVLQNNLLERLTADKKWRINYTPGWYDRAQTDHLQIKLVFACGLPYLFFGNPAPNSVNNNVIPGKGLTFLQEKNLISRLKARTEISNRRRSNSQSTSDIRRNQHNFHYCHNNYFGDRRINISWRYVKIECRDAEPKSEWNR